MPLLPGSIAPYFRTPATCNPNYAFDTVAGRPVILVFLTDPGDPRSQGLIALACKMRGRFDDVFASLFYVVKGPAELAWFGLADDYPGVRCLFDPERHVARAFALPASSGELSSPAVVALDRHLRVILTAAGDRAVEGFGAAVKGIEMISAWRAQQRSLGHAPVLVVDRIFDLPLCRTLIEYYHSRGGRRSGFMRETGGITKGMLDDDFKRRNDVTIDEPKLKTAMHPRIKHCLAPLIKQAFHFDATRIERDIVACYDGAERGFFRPHRDNTSKATAYRKFAVTLNLNTEEYEGGDLRFPEYGETTYRAPTGGAVVFSGSLLHEALPVTRGLRYAYLPFLYGEGDAPVRQEGEYFLDMRSGGKADARSAGSLPGSLGHFGLVDDEPIY
jgi:hypothetical protein